MEFFSYATQHIDALHNTSNISIVIGLVIIFISIIIYAIKNKGLPPGPTGVPILGYWPFLNKETCHLQLLAFKKKYGDVFSFKITGRLYINLASLKALREAHVTKADCFRERTTAFSILSTLFRGTVVYSYSDQWVTLRKFFLMQFRERGMTIFKENTAEAMYGTISTTVEELKRNAGKPLDIIGILTKNGNQIIRHTLLGAATPITEEDVTAIHNCYRTVVSLIHSTNLILIGNIAKYLITPFLPNYKESMNTHHRLRTIFYKMVNDHKRTFDGDNIRDIIDSYIKERNDRRSKGDPTHEYFTDDGLVGSLIQFVGDGVVNLAAFITFFLKALIDHPEEQEKIYKELIEVVGENRNPGLEDKSKLTYTNAFMLEAQRTTNFVPIFPSLECTKETTVGGYRIPKGAITLTNFYAIHNDSQLYEEPEKFNPSRYLPQPGKPKAESPITFGVGKRVCLGESFVMTQVFLFCTAIVKHFHLKQSDGKSYQELIESRILDICVTPRK